MLSGVDRRDEVPKSVFQRALSAGIGTLEETYLCKACFNGPAVAKAQLVCAQMEH